jgi:hypothetical protein
MAKALMTAGIDVESDRASVNIWNRVLKAQGVRVLGEYELGEGEVFYVHRTDGNDNNDGKTPANPFSTLQAAIDACTDDRGDVIVKMPGASLQTTDAAINFNCAGVTLIGALGAGNVFQPEKHLIYRTDTGGPCFNITQPCAIIGVEVWTYATSEGAINVDGDAGGYGGGFGLIANCRFVKWGTVDYGVYFFGGGYWHILNNEFDGLDGGVGLYSRVHGCTSITIAGNTFRNCTYGLQKITGGSAPHDVVYKSNVHVDSKAIAKNAGNIDGICADNWLETATDAASYDDTVNNFNTAGMQMSDCHYAE